MRVARAGRHASQRFAVAFVDLVQRPHVAADARGGAAHCPIEFDDADRQARERYRQALRRSGEQGQVEQVRGNGEARQRHARGVQAELDRRRCRLASGALAQGPDQLLKIDPDRRDLGQTAHGGQ